ncbi:unnamed protein product [Boreogadus saida]
MNSTATELIFIPPPVFPSRKHFQQQKHTDRTSSAPPVVTTEIKMARAVPTGHTEATNTEEHTNIQEKNVRHVNVMVNFCRRRGGRGCWRGCSGRVDLCRGDVVCYVADRNELRSRVIQWLQTEVVPDGWFNKGSNFSDILLRYFKTYDNGDTQLDSSELLKFIQHNDSNVDMQSYADQESNRLLRSLCVDALIELSDDNADWKLSFDEFLNCLKPGFNPPEKKCALEDETYEDGAETQVECNRCVCACGNWVCTAMTCADKAALGDESADAGAEVTEEEWNRRVAELNKHQETVEKMKASTKEV